MDIFQQFLLDKKKTTQRIYQTKLRLFFEFAGLDASELFGLTRARAIVLVMTYKNCLKNKGLAPATINNHLAAIKSFVAYGHKVEACDYVLADVEGVRVEVYRDTTGVTPEKFKELIAYVDLDTLKGKRDYALLRLLWENALRRDEVSYCQLVDYVPEENNLWIHGKGRSQKEIIKIGSRVIKAIEVWICARKKAKIETEYLFCSLSHRPQYKGTRLQGDGIYRLVRQYGDLAGIDKIISPHRIRHSSITAVLDVTGDIRKTQQLSRHKSIETVVRYDDSRLLETCW